MSLEWLAPAGVALVALSLLPILSHLIRRPPKERWFFGAMMLLERAKKSPTKRTRVHDWLLLLIRILLLLLLGLAMLQPQLQWPNPNEPLDRASKVVVLIDQSLSMNQRVTTENSLSVLEQVKKDAQNELKDIPEEIDVLILSFAKNTDELTDGFSKNKAAALSSIQTIVQTQEEGNLVQALRAARRSLEGKGGEIWLYTDQAGDFWTEELEDEIRLLVEQNIALKPRPVAPSSPQNITVSTAKYGEGVEGGAVNFTVVNFGSEDREVHCQVLLPNDVEINTFVTVPAEDSAEAFVTVPRVVDGGVATIKVEDPYLELDNEFHFHLPRIGASRVLVVDGDPGAASIESEVYFLERALSPLGSGGKLQGIVPDIIGEHGLGALNPDTHQVVFLANITNPSAISTPLINFVRSGGGLVLSLGSNTSIDSTNAALADVLPSPLREVKTLSQDYNFAPKTKIPNASHEIFTPFLRGGLQEFSNVAWKKIVALEPFQESDDTKVLLNLENEMPLFIEHKVGNGRVILITSTIDMDWGNLPLQSVYMPLIQRMVGYLGGVSSASMRQTCLVGEDCFVEWKQSEQNLVWSASSGIIAAQVKEQRAILNTGASGAYQLSISGGPALAWVAMNTSISEADVQVKREILETAAEIAPEFFLEKENLTGWLWLAAIILFLVQALLAFPVVEPAIDVEEVG